MAAVAGGLVPTTRVVTDPMMLYLAIGILGATVMPHNRYLHSAVVQTRAVAPDPASKRQALRLATLDSSVALTLALFINAAILILAAATFHVAGRHDVADIDQRSEEHTSELQSLMRISYAVFCLKKKKKKHQKNNNYT